MLNVVLLPILTILGGAAGYLLRQWELNTAFDAAGLATLTNPASLLLIVLSVVMAVIIYLLSRRANSEAEYGAAFFTSGNWVYLLVMALAAACILAGGVFGLRNDMLSGSGRNFLWLLFRLMCLVCFVCVPISAWNNFRGKQHKYSLTLVAPAYMACLWLVTTYQLRSANSVVLDYVYELLAIICVLVGLYYTAGFSFGKGKPQLCVLFSLLGVYFSIVTLADPLGRTSKIIFLFAILYHLANMTILLRNTFSKKNTVKSTQEVDSHE